MKHIYKEFKWVSYFIKWEVIRIKVIVNKDYIQRRKRELSNLNFIVRTFLDKRMQKCLLSWESFGWVLLEKFLYKIPQLLVLNFRQIIAAVHYFLDCLFSFGMIKRRIAGVKFIGYAADGPHIDWRAMGLVEHNFRSYIIQCAHKIIGDFVNGAPKISNLECMALNKKKSTFEIKMLAGFRSLWTIFLPWR